MFYNADVALKKNQTQINAPKKISITGAKLHNLKNVSVDIPHKSLTIITGVSGSGKSTLAFDTVYAEGQRRFVESLSAYARQFLERMNKPDVDSISGLPPAVAIEQKPAPKNPRSTVGTTTEIYDYLRLLYGRIGITYCRCGRIVKKYNPASIVSQIQKFDEGSKLFILFPFITKEKNYKNELQNLLELGFSRIISDESDEIINLEKDTEGFIKTNRSLETSEKGIFAAGDCRDTNIWQLVSAVRDGALAATAANEYIESLKEQVK